MSGHACKHLVRGSAVAVVVLAVVDVKVPVWGMLDCLDSFAALFAVERSPIDAVLSANGLSIRFSSPFSRSSSSLVVSSFV